MKAVGDLDRLGRALASAFAVTARAVAAPPAPPPRTTTRRAGDPPAGRGPRIELPRQRQPAGGLPQNQDRADPERAPPSPRRLVSWLLSRPDDLADHHRRHLDDLHVFVQGLRKDAPAVVAGLTLPYGNGPAEGVNTKVERSSGRHTEEPASPCYAREYCSANSRERPGGTLPTTQSKAQHTRLSPLDLLDHHAGQVQWAEEHRGAFVWIPAHRRSVRF